MFSVYFCFFPELKEKIECGKPPPTDNGTAVIEREIYSSGDSIFYKCVDGYEIQGSNKIICRKGKWTEPPKCKGKSILEQKHN